MKNIHRVFIPTPRILSYSVNVNTAVTIEHVCCKAGYRYKVTGGNPPKVILHLSDNAIGWTSQNEKVYLVDIRELNLETQAGWSAVLETLAYGFFDYAARESAKHI